MYRVSSLWARTPCSMVLALVGALEGCATPELVAPPSDALRARLDRVKLQVSATSKPAWRSVDTIMVDEGQAEKFANASVKAGGFTALVGCQPEWQWAWVLTCPAGIVAGVGVMAVGATGAGIYDAATSKARTQPEIDAAVAALDESLQATRLADEVRERLERRIGETTSTIVVADDDSAVRLILDVDRFSLTTEGRISPDLWLDFAVTASLTHVSHDQPHYQRRWGYYAEIGDFYELTDSGAIGLRQALDTAFDAMAASIVDDLFLGSEHKRLYSAGEVEGEVVAIRARRAPIDARSSTGIATHVRPDRPYRVVMVEPVTSIPQRASVAAEEEIRKALHAIAKRLDAAQESPVIVAAVESRGDLWQGDFARLTPRDDNVEAFGKALQADVVLMAYYKRSQAGWYTTERYDWEGYLFEIGSRRSFQVRGDQSSITADRERLLDRFLQARGTTSSATADSPSRLTIAILPPGRAIRASTFPSANTEESAIFAGLLKAIDEQDSLELIDSPQSSVHSNIYMRPGSYWTGAVEKRPVDENVYAAGESMNVDFALLFYWELSARGLDITYYLFDIKAREPYQSEGRGLTHDEAETLARTVLGQSPTLHAGVVEDKP